MILVWLQHDGVDVQGVSLEALALARGVAAAAAAPIGAALLGPGAAAAAAGLAGRGVVVAHVVEDPRLEAFAPEAWAAALQQLAAVEGATAVVAAGDDRGNEVMARLAARLDLPMAANCVEVRGVTGPFELTRQRWGGSLLEDAELDGPVKLLTVAPHAVAAGEPDGGPPPEVRRFEPAVDDADLAVRVVNRVAPESAEISLADAKVVVGGGRGVGGAEGFGQLERLAELLGGTVGVSRVVTSLGWRPHSDQVGQTGTRIAPDIYIACGISGAIQHMVGCRGAKHLMAINTDPEAPIMAKADFAVVGDLHQVLDAVIAEIERTGDRG